MVRVRVNVTLLVLVAASLILSQPAFAQDQLCGPATADKDGDDVFIDGNDIRLHGIDAFERDQTCTQDGKTWPCGDAARRKLKELVEGRGEVCCRRMQARETRGRVVMRCLLGEIDVGQEMVRAGLALDCPRFSRERYKADEAAAKAEKRGAWAGTFKAPWVWKRQAYCCALNFRGVLSLRLARFL
jgi:endonuclease YncB( thermonuclease family)